jgi:hypothetical protein
MSNLLVWLALPMLVTPWLARAGRVGGATSQLVMAGLGLAALHQGAGTFDPRDLQTIADQSPRDAWFVGITAGAMLSGGCLFPDLRNWRKVIPALPLLIALLDIAMLHVAPLAVGLIIGIAPMAAGRVLAEIGSTPAMVAAPFVTPANRLSLALAVMTIVVALWGPASLAMFGLAALAWCEWRRHGTRRVPVLEVAATLLLIGWTWLAVTIAASPLPSFRSIGIDAPISPTAAEALALLAVGWGLAIAAPWPLDRLARVTVQLVPVAVVLHLAAMHVTPDGIAHWQPLLSSVLVVAALAAIASYRWDGAAAAMMMLGATRGGVLPVAGAVMMAFVPAIRWVHVPATLRSAMVALATTLVLVGLLQDQVLLSVIVALGIVTLANRADHVVARVLEPIHL